MFTLCIYIYLSVIYIALQLVSMFYSYCKHCCSSSEPIIKIILRKCIPFLEKIEKYESALILELRSYYLVDFLITLSLFWNSIDH